MGTQQEILSPFSENQTFENKIPELISILETN